MFLPARSSSLCPSRWMVALRQIVSRGPSSLMPSTNKSYNQQLPSKHLTTSTHPDRNTHPASDISSHIECTYNAVQSIWLPQNRYWKASTLSRKKNTLKDNIRKESVCLNGWFPAATKCLLEAEHKNYSSVKQNLPFRDPASQLYQDFQSLKLHLSLSLISHRLIFFRKFCWVTQEQDSVNKLCSLIRHCSGKNK